MIRKIKNYLAVGAMAFSVEYALFLLLFGVSGNLLFSQTISFTAGLLVSFLGNRALTFRSRTSQDYTLSQKAQLVRYLALAATNLFITNVLIYILVDLVGIGYVLAKLLVMCSVVVWNFVVFSKFIFGNNSPTR